MIVWLASYPRSGNTFARHILKQLYGQTAWSVYDEQAIEGLFDPPHKWEGEEPEGIQFIKTHREQDAATKWPALYLVRDRRDALMSQANHASKCGAVAKGRDPLEIFAELEAGELCCPIEGELPWNWDRHVDTWTKREAPTAVIEFADLVGFPKSTLAGSLEQIGIYMAVAERDIFPLSRLNQCDERFFSGVAK